MSLLTSASIWQNDDSNKKRVSTMQKPDINNSYNDIEENINKFKNSSPPSMDDLNKSNEVKNNRVNELLNKMTSINIENDGNKLSNFVPMTNPELTKAGQDTSNENRFHAPMSLPTPTTEYNSQKINSTNSTQQFSSNDSNLANLSNYRNIYQPVNTKPYYSNIGISTGTDNKLLEKINYMIHLLEEQQNEKTSNITEEFILYTFLGIFIIYVLDSFARTGKYIR